MICLPIGIICFIVAYKGLKSPNQTDKSIGAVALIIAIICGGILGALYDWYTHFTGE